MLHYSCILPSVSEEGHRESFTARQQPTGGELHEDSRGNCFFFFLHILISTVTGCSPLCGNAVGKHTHDRNAIRMKRFEYWHHRPSREPAFNASIPNPDSGLVHVSEKRRRNFRASSRPAAQVRPSLRHGRTIFECAVNLWLWFRHRDVFRRLQSELPLTGWRVFTAVGGFMKKLRTAYTVQIYAG